MTFMVRPCPPLSPIVSCVQSHWLSFHSVSTSRFISEPCIHCCFYLETSYQIFTQNPAPIVWAQSPSWITQKQRSPSYCPSHYPFLVFSDAFPCLI